MMNLSDPTIAAAAANVFMGVLLTAVSLGFFVHWWSKDLARRWIALSYMGMGVLGAVVYYAIIFVNPSLNISILRGGWFMWSVIAIGVLFWVHTVETARFDYQCRQKLEELDGVIANLKQLTDSQQATIRLLQKVVKEQEGEIDDLKRGLARLTADLVSREEGAVND